MSQERRPQSAAVVHKAARAQLGGTGALFPPHTRGAGVRQALLHCGYGLALLEGEHVVAFWDQGGDPADFSGLILTDHMLLARSGQEIARAPLAQIDAAQAHEGWLQTSLRLTMGQEEAEIPVLGHARELAAMLEQIAQQRYAPQERHVPLLSPGPEDPTGLHQLMASLQDPLPEVVALLESCAARRQSGQLSQEATLDCAVRAALLHRATSYGYPSHKGLWLSALRRPALAGALQSLLQGRGELRLDQGRLRTVLDLNPREKKSLIPDREQIQEALLTSMADRFTRQALGVELSDILEEEVTSLRLVLEDGPQTQDLTGAEPRGEVGSAWSKLRGVASSLLGGDQASGALTSFCVQGWLGGRYVDLAPRRPEIVAQLLTQLADLEISLLRK